MDVAQLTQALAKRGPDATRTLMVEPCTDSSITMIGSLLALRGEPTPQPISDADGNILLFNGQVTRSKM